MSQTNSSFGAFLRRYRVRIARVIFIALLVYVFGYRRIPLAEFDSTLGIAGLIVIALGLLVRTLSAGTLHKNDILATTGLYALVRNPLYFGSLLLLVGVNLIIADPLTFIVSVALFLGTYIPTILGEERGLRIRYEEEWDNYKASTPRLIPNPLKLGALSQMSWNFQQWRTNHEHNTVLAAIGIVILLALYDAYWAVSVTG